MLDEKISIVEAIIRNEKEEILLLKRSEKNKHYVGKWQLPGGKVEFNEDVESAIKREIFEELGLSTKKFKLKKVFSIENKDFDKVSTVFIMIFDCIAKGKIKLSPDHCDYKFISEDKIDKSTLTLVSKKAIFE